MELSIDLQLAHEDPDFTPEPAALKRYVTAALEGADYHEDAELTVRMTDSQEIRELNRDYRHMDKPTNILSFPFECPPEVKLPLLGDLIVCTEVLKREAGEQGKSVEEHFAHLIVHGTLHLLGYDHIEDDEALVMESLESRVVMALGFADPYASEKD